MPGERIDEINLRIARRDTRNGGTRHQLRYLELQPVVVLWPLVLVLTTALAALDYLTGFELSFAVFYLCPVALAAWTLGRVSGLLVSVFAALLWLGANTLAGESYSNQLVPLWNTGTRIGFFAVVALLLSELRGLLDYERSLAQTDFLTGALNSRAFYDSVAAEIVRARRYRHPLTILYIDLDNFKSVNDRFGHNTGDNLLHVVADIAAQMTRTIDRVARIGGDEFCVLLPETAGTGARILAPRLRDALLEAMRERNWPVTFSIGALTYESAPPDTQELIRVADQLMYTVKSTSKDAIGYAVYGGAR